jgi:hypothetical protein
MYASSQYVPGYFAVSDQRQASRRAADRHAQVSAAVESKRERSSARREARGRRGHAAVPATT